MSGGGGNNSGVDYQREAANRAFEYDTAVYEHQWGAGGIMWDKYEDQIRQRAIDRISVAAQRQYQDRINSDSWQYQKNVNDQLYQNQLNAYNKSNTASINQKNLNTRVWQTATGREYDIYQEGLAQQTFEDRRVAQELLELTGGLGYEKTKLQNALGLANTEFDYQRNQWTNQYNQDVASANLDDRQRQVALSSALAQLEDSADQAHRRSTSAQKKADIDIGLTDTEYAQSEANILYEQGRQRLNIAGREELAAIDQDQAMSIRGVAIERAELERKAADLNYNKEQTRAYIARNETNYKKLDAQQQAQIDKQLLDLNYSDIQREGATKLDKVAENLRATQDSAEIKRRIADLDYASSESQADIGERQSQLKLRDTTQSAEIQRQQAELDFDYAASQSDISKRKSELSLQDLGGSLGYAEEKARRDYIAKESASRFEQAAVGLELQEAKQRSDYERDLLNRELQELKAKNAIELNNAQVQALKQAGEAALSQSGRSQSKAIMGVAAAIGRQQAALVSSITRAESMADSKIRQSKQNKLSAIQQAAIKEQKITQDRLTSLATLTADIGEVGRELSIGRQQAALDIESIQSNLATELQKKGIRTQDIQNIIDTATAESGLDIESIQNNLATELQKKGIKKDDIDNIVRTATAQKDIEVKDIEASVRSELERTGLKKQDIDEILTTTENLADLSLEEIEQTLTQALIEKGLRKDEVDNILQSSLDKYDIDTRRTSAELDTVKSLGGLTIDKLTEDLQRQGGKRGLDLQRITDELSDEQYLAELQKSGFIEQQGFQRSSAQIELERILDKKDYSRIRSDSEKAQINNRQLNELLKTNTNTNYLDDQTNWAYERRALDRDIGMQNRAELAKTYSSNLTDINIQKDAADQRADYNRMLYPTRPVDIPVPEALPVEDFGPSIRRPTAPPVPQLGAKMSYDGTNALDVIGGLATGASAAIGAYSTLAKTTFGAQAGLFGTGSTMAGSIAWPLGLGMAAYSIFS